MWKNVFIEAGVLSLLIFGGFYVNTSILKKEIILTNEAYRADPNVDAAATRLHISGRVVTAETHISGLPHKSKGRSSISGVPQPPVHVSGNDV